MKRTPKPPLTPVTAKLGARARARRRELGLTQENLAERATLHWTFVGQVERGQRNITLHNIVRLADALEVNPAVLIDGLTFTR
jgi:transcriptional regulator with XRE-family HTH domain